jgi:hypothetical protein
VRDHRGLEFDAPFDRVDDAWREDFGARTKTALQAARPAPQV